VLLLLLLLLAASAAFQQFSQRFQHGRVGRVERWNGSSIFVNQNRKQKNINTSPGRRGGKPEESTASHKHMKDENSVRKVAVVQLRDEDMRAEKRGSRTRH